MSFASEMKNELTRIEADDCCSKAELAALIRMNGNLSISNREWVINVQSENAAIARRVFSLIKKIFGVEIELLVRKKMKLKKNNVYICRIKTKARDILEELGILVEGSFTHEIEDHLVKNNCCKRSYLRGLFSQEARSTIPKLPLITWRYSHYTKVTHAT